MTHSGANGGGTALISDTNTAGFTADVLEESLNQPVLVDFWAPWCGPCRTLGPAIEKVVTEFGGQVKLVKINVDENQQLSAQMGVQSIPAVFAFAGGRPVDGFMGAVPESEVRRFIERVIAAAPPPQLAGDDDSFEAQVGEALAAAEKALEDQDLERAGQLFGLVLQNVPDRAEAILGMAQVYHLLGHAEEVRAALETLPEAERKGERYEALSKALALAEEARGLGEVEVLEKKVEADPDDYQARFDLALVYNASDERLKAAETLVALLRRSREWNEDGARLKLLELFEAWGPKDPATLRGRRLLSAALFS